MKQRSVDTEAEKRVVGILKRVGAIVSDSHFVYTSGKHGSVYINKDAIYPHIRETSTICRFMARRFVSQPIDAVAGPALGGIILSQWTAYHLTRMKKQPVLGLYTEKTAEGDQLFRRGYEKLVQGKNVLVVEDLTTTGGSVRKVVDSVHVHLGSVVAVCVMVNRDPVHVTSSVVDAPFSALCSFSADAYDPGACPLCASGVAINTELGHGKEFLKRS